MGWKTYEYLCCHFAAKLYIQESITAFLACNVHLEDVTEKLNLRIEFEFQVMYSFTISTHNYVYKLTIISLDENIQQEN